MAFSAQRLLQGGGSPPSMSFVSRTLPGNERAEAFSYFLDVDPSGIFVTAGRRLTSGDVYAASSPDGIVWTERTTPFSGAADKCRAGVYGKDRFIAVMDGTSAPKIVEATGVGNWAVRNTAPNSTQGYVAMAYSPSGDIYAAFLGAGIFTSPTAETWTSRSFSGTLITRTMRWGDGGGGFFLQLGFQFSNSTQLLNTSPDGITWSLQSGFGSIATETRELHGGAYSAELDRWVVVGSSLGSGSDARIYTAESSPENSWTERSNSLAHVSHLFDVIAIPGFGFLAVGYETISSNQRGRILSSPDGITWTEETDHPFQDTNNRVYRAVAHHAGRICMWARDSSDNMYMVSN